MKSLQWALTLITLSLLAQCNPKKTETKTAGIISTKDTVTYIPFEKTAPVNDSSDIGVNWKVEKPISEFTLVGKSPLNYKFELINDSIAVLSQKVNDTWLEHDRFEFQPWHWFIDDEKIISQFRIADFDKDGDDDLICWVLTNVNRNEFTYIYLNDGKKLVKLYDNAEDSFFWFSPEYNQNKKELYSTWLGSAYGHDDECVYKLENLSITPVFKHHQERSGKEIRDEYYNGKNGKWKLVKTETEEVSGQ